MHIPYYNNAQTPLDFRVCMNGLMAKNGVIIRVCKTRSLFNLGKTDNIYYCNFVMVEIGYGSISRTPYKVNLCAPYTMRKSHSHTSRVTTICIYNVMCYI